jgi:hypothetical protein
MPGGPKLNQIHILVEMTTPKDGQECKKPFGIFLVQKKSKLIEVAAVG